MLLRIKRISPEESWRESLCFNYRLKREQGQPTPCATWGGKWGPWAGRKGAWDEAWPWKRSRESGMRDSNRQDHKEQEGVSAQWLLNSHHHPYQGASCGQGCHQQILPTFSMGTTGQLGWRATSAIQVSWGLPKPLLTYAWSAQQEWYLPPTPGPGHVWGFAEQAHPHLFLLMQLLFKWLRTFINLPNRRLGSLTPVEEMKNPCSLCVAGTREWQNLPCLNRSTIYKELL